MKTISVIFVFLLGVVACGEGRSDTDGRGRGDSDFKEPVGDARVVDPDASAPDDPRDPDPVGSDWAGTMCVTLAPKLAECFAQPFSEADCRSVYGEAEARGCQRNYIEAFSAFVEARGTFECVNFGFGNNLYPQTQDENVLIGMTCPLTVASPSCRSISCEYNQDCGTQESCNDVTRACYELNAICPSLPCKYEQDCPSGHACNDALGVCAVN